MRRFHLVIGFALLSAGTGLAAAADAPATSPATTTPPATTDTSNTAQPPATQPAAPAATQPDPNEKICKQDKMTGSRVAGKVCKTQKEWDEEAAKGSSDF